MASVANRRNHDNELIVLNKFMNEIMETVTLENIRTPLQENGVLLRHEYEMLLGCDMKTERFLDLLKTKEWRKLSNFRSVLKFNGYARLAGKMDAHLNDINSGNVNPRSGTSDDQAPNSIDITSDGAGQITIQTEAIRNLEQCYNESEIRIQELETALAERKTEYDEMIPSNNQLREEISNMDASWKQTLESLRTEEDTTKQLKSCIEEREKELETARASLAEKVKELASKPQKIKYTLKEHSQERDEDRRRLTAVQDTLDVHSQERDEYMRRMTAVQDTPEEHRQERDEYMRSLRAVQRREEEKRHKQHERAKKLSEVQDTPEEHRQERDENRRRLRAVQRRQEEERRKNQERTMKLAAEPLLLLYAELKDKLRRDQCRAIAKDIEAERPLPAEEQASFQEMTKRRDLVDWVLKYVLNQKDEMIFKIFCESLGKQSPSLGQTLQETSVQKHELMKTERQPTTLQPDHVHFLQRSFNSKLVVDIIIDKLLSRFLITAEEHSSIRSSNDESEMTKRLEALLQYDTEITQQYTLITQSFRNASVSQTADWLVPLHAQAKETLSCGKGLAIATDIFQQIPGIISESDLYELYDLKDNSRDVIDRLLKHIYRHPRPEVFDVICYSLKKHDEDLYEHFLRMFFFKGCDKEKARPVVNKDSALPSGSGTDYLYHILRSRQTLDVVIDHLLSSFCITVDQHSDIRNDDSIHLSIKQLVELLEQSPQTIVAVNAILRHLDKVADTKNTGDKEITITVDFGNPEVNSQAKNYMNSLCGHTLPLADIGQLYINDVIDGSVVIKISPLDRESLRRFRDMEMDGTILEYLRDHVEVFLPDDVEIDLSELSIGVKEETTNVPVQSESIINATIELSSGEVYKMENEPFVQGSFLKYSECIGCIRMCPEELLSRKTERNSSDQGLVFAGRLGSNGEPLAIKRMLLPSYANNMRTYKTVKERLQHRNIVKIFYVVKDGRYGYVAMERMDENLVEYVARLGQHGTIAMNTEEEIYYMKHIVTGLAFIHEKGFLHNMFSPNAILLKKNNPATHPKQVSIACFSNATNCECVPVSCKKGTNDVLALIKVLLFVLNKEETFVNDNIQAENRIIQSGHFDIYILLRYMLDSRQLDELKMQECVLHPALSSPSDQLQFLKVSDRLRRELNVDFNMTNMTSVNINNPWLDEPPLTHIVHQYLINLRRPYGRPHCLNSLVHCIRNCHEHLPDITPQVQEEFDPRECYIYYWLVKFPGLVSSVYEAMRPHKGHTDLIRFFTIEN